MLYRNRVVALLSLFAVALAVLLPAAPASAQGTGGALPGPIDSQQLAHIAKRLGLSDSQRHAMEAAHDEYRSQFRLLREGEIAEFLQEQGAMQGGLPQRDEVERLFETMERLQGKIAVLDNRLFDRLLPALTAEQQALLPRLRMTRERRRYESLQRQASFGRASVDLSAIFHDLDLTAAARQAADPMVATYERRLTALMRKQAKAVMGMTMDMVDQLAARGFSDMSQEELMTDPKLMQEVFGAIQEIFKDLRGRLAKLGSDLDDLNTRTEQQVSAALGGDSGRTFRNTYVTRAYPRLARLAAQSEDDWMAKALRLETLSVGERDVLAGASGEHQRRLEQLIDGGSTKVREYLASFSPFDMSGGSARELNEDLESLRAQADGALATADTVVVEQLGADTVDRLRDATARMSSAAALAGATGDESETEDAGAADEVAFDGDPYLPDRIGRKEVVQYARQLDMEDDVRDVLNVLHDDYIQRLSELAVLGELREARASIYARDDSVTAPVAERIDRTRMLRRSALDAITAIEGEFFENLRSIVRPEREAWVDRIRRLRGRRAHAGRAARSFGNTSSESSVDVVGIVLGIEPTTEEMAQLDAELSGYEQAAASAFRQRYEARMRVRSLREEWTAEASSVSRESAEDIAALVTRQQRFAEVMEEPQAAVAAAEAAVMALNRASIERVVEMLSAERARELRRAYDLAAFPSIYEDPSAIEVHLAAAMDLDDLSAHQREQLIELGGPYRAEYEALSRQMTEHLDTMGMDALGFDRDRWRAWQERQQALTRIRFERNELNGRAISRLQTILDETQIARIGGLPDPPGEDESPFLR